MARPTAAVPQLTKDDVRFLERALAALPTGKTEASAHDADGLLKYGYHQNPYMRTFVKILWSGYAISSNQLADGSQRFSQARRDATVSNIDQATTKTLDDAAKALEGAMSPSGSLGSFLTELRDKTMPRLWSRVCETAGLPPPSFHAIYGGARPVSQDDLDAEEEAEMAALRKVPAAAPATPLTDDDEDGNRYADVDVDEESDPDEVMHTRRIAPRSAPVERVEGDPDQIVHELPSRERAPRQPQPPREGGQREGAAGEAGLNVTVARNGGAELAAELLMSALSEVLKELRTKQATGPLKFTVHVEGQRAQRAGGDRSERAEGGEGSEGQRRRRRRR